MFQIKTRDGLARIGFFDTPHGRVETPTLLPVINPNLRTITVSEMRRELPLQAVITNSYIIWRSKELHARALEEGVHSIIDTDLPVMTDSGTFQSHVYGGVSVEPQEIVEFQRDIGADMGTVLDIFSEPWEDRKAVLAGWKTTLERTRAASAIKGEMLLSGVVQGGVYPDLREKYGRDLADVDVDIHPIGGVVPLMEDYRYPDLARVIIGSKKGLDPSRPVHLFGAGHPMVFPLAALLGCDLFDSSSYIKYARDGRMMFRSETLKLKDMEDIPCSCPSCRGFSAAEMRKAADRVERVAMHNLRECFHELSVVKNAIRRGKLWDLAEERSASHPGMGGVLRAMNSESEFLDLFEPNSRGAPFRHLLPDSWNRPLAKRVRRKLERFVNGNGGAVLEYVHERNPEADGAFVRRVWRSSGELVFAKHYYGCVPHGLLTTYPFGQSVIPREPDDATLERMKEEWSRFMEKQGAVTPSDEHGETEDGDGPDLAAVRQICDFQFGPGTGGILTDGNVELVRSKRTGKLRNVVVDGEHVLSLRAGEGLFSLKPDGARRLLRYTDPPRMRAVVDDESAEFNAQGKNVFPQFIKTVDDNLRPGDEVMVVNTEGELAAVGRMVLAPLEVPYFKGGVAIRVRDGAGTRT